MLSILRGRVYNTHNVLSVRDVSRFKPANLDFVAVNPRSVTPPTPPPPIMTALP